MPHFGEMLYDPERGDERRDSIEFRIGLRKRACRRAGNAGKVGDPVIYLVDDQCPPRSPGSSKSLFGPESSRAMAKPRLF